ncbi:MAG: hypothetical protein WAQ98_33775 [Blastocatellia bacterium]
MKEVAAKTTKISLTNASTNVGLMPVTTITIVTTSYGDSSSNNSVNLVKEVKKVKEVKEQISSNNNDAATTSNIPNIPNVAISRVIAFLANIDKAVEERLAKWSKAKKLTLAASLCLVGLLGATFTAFSTIKDTVNATTKSVKAINSSEMEQSLAFLKMSKAKEILHTSDNNSSNNQNIEVSEVAESWQSIESLLASTPQRRKQALAKLGLRNNGDYLVAAISLGCDSCIRLAKEINSNAANNAANDGDKINKLEPDNKQYINQSLTRPVMMVTIASESEIKTWQREHLLSYPVQSISESMMNDLGIVFFPTLIKVSNGQILGVSQSSSVLAKQPSGVKDNGK